MNHLYIEYESTPNEAKPDNNKICKCIPEFTHKISNEELDDMYSDLNNITNDKLDLSTLGTAFDILVWTEIQKIPFGSTRTYKEIANNIGKPSSCRAVANACGRNKLALIIPCHRVVGSNDLGGYKWGIELKIRLLEYEGALSE